MIFFRVIVVCVVFFVSPVIAGELMHIKDMRRVFFLVEKQKLPLLIIFSTDECEYCEYIKENYLAPMQKDQAYRDRVLIRELNTESYYGVIDKHGEKTTADVLALRYGADITPTIVFLDSRGNELSEKIVGLKAPDYFDLLLDEAIDASLKKLR